MISARAQKFQRIIHKTIIWSIACVCLGPIQKLATTLLYKWHIVVTLFNSGLVHLAVNVESLFERPKDLPSTHHHHRPPLLRWGDLHRVDGGEKDAVAKTNKEPADVYEQSYPADINILLYLPDIDERQACCASDADPGQ